MSGHAPNTTELSELRLRLRDDLEFVMREYAGEQYCVIEDHARSRFYQIGIAEYTLISLLDGKTTLAEAIRLTSTRLGEQAFTQHSAVSIVKWLSDCELVSTDDFTRTSKLAEKAASERHRRLATRLNPILLKVPLFNPERMLNALTPWFGWLSSQAAFVGWLVLCCAAIVQVLSHHDELVSATAAVVDRGNWIWLAATWLGLRFFHELGHALTCRNFGGRVRDCGVMLILLVPIPYVDVTHSWRFASKWQRIATSAAGMYVELAIAAAAAIVWAQSENPLVQHHAYNIMLLGSLTTLLFNANFLMRFDGYYILADLLEIPNLYSLGQQYATYLGKRYALGIKVDAPRWRRGILIRAYSVASLLWRTFVCVCLVMSAQALLFGFGLILSLLGMLLWFAMPLYRLLQFILDRKSTQSVSFQRVSVTVGCTILFVVSTFTVIPWPGRVSAPATVEYSNAVRIHTEAAGVVKAVYVQPGQRVQRGDVLLELRNVELATRLAEIELLVKQTHSRARQYQLREQLGAYQSESASLEGLNQKLDDLHRKVEGLQVRAVQAGVIVGRDLDLLVDQYLKRGTEVLTIADTSKKKLTLSIAQDDIAHFRAQLGQEVVVCAIPHTDIQGQLDWIAPTASDNVAHEALTAAAGGPIPVRAVEDASNSQQRWRCLDPQFEGMINLSPDEAKRMRVGQTVRVKLTTSRGTLGGQLSKRVADWLGSINSERIDHQARTAEINDLRR